MIAHALMVKRSVNGGWSPRSSQCSIERRPKASGDESLDPSLYRTSGFPGSLHWRRVHDSEASEPAVDGPSFARKRLSASDGCFSVSLLRRASSCARVNGPRSRGISLPISEFFWRTPNYPARVFGGRLGRRQRRSDCTFTLGEEARLVAACERLVGKPNYVAQDLAVASAPIEGAEAIESPALDRVDLEIDLLGSGH